VTRSFFELPDLLRVSGHDRGSRLSTGRDTCFVNIVRPHRTPWFISEWRRGNHIVGWPAGEWACQQLPAWRGVATLPCVGTSPELVLGFGAGRKALRKPAGHATDRNKCTLRVMIGLLVVMTTRPYSSSTAHLCSLRSNTARSRDSIRRAVPRDGELTARRPRRCSPSAQTEPCRPISMVRPVRPRVPFSKRPRPSLAFVVQLPGQAFTRSSRSTAVPSPRTAVATGRCSTVGRSPAQETVGEAGKWVKTMAARRRRR
jgi:hypothetical protein